MYKFVHLFRVAVGGERTAHTFYTTKKQQIKTKKNKK